MHTQRNTLNIVPGGVPLSIHVTQYDEGSTYEFKVYSVPGQFDTSDVVQVNLEGTKPDGYGIINACSFADGVVTYTIQQHLTAAAGTVRSKIVFYGESSKVLGSAVVNWIVDKAGVTDDTIISDSDISGLESYVDGLRKYVSTPLPAATVSAMTDTDKIYLYTGSESGYTSGNWYYYNGTAWVSGGIYGGTSVDATLSVAGEAADAKATGDAVDDLKSALASALPTASASGAVASFTDGANNIPVDDLKIIIEPKQSGSGDPSPDNVRAISGWTGANVVRTGKNLYSRELSQYNVPVYATDGTSATYPDVAAWWIKVEPNTQYTLTLKKSTHDYYVRVIYCRGNKSFINRIMINGNTEASYTISTPANCQWLEIAVNQYDVNNLNKNDWEMQIEEGAVATEYEPYTGQTYPISFGSAGTVYGGTLDVTNGVLTVDRAMVDLGTLTWTYLNDGIFRTPKINGMIYEFRPRWLCSAYSIGEISNYAGWKQRNNQIGYLEGGSFVICMNTAYTDAASFASAMNGQKLVYVIDTPIVYDLTPTEVRTLLGNNNIFADTGDSAVEYKADTGRYIENRISAQQKLISGVETSYTATKNYAVGNYVIVNDTLYKATAAIATGATITPGTNCVATTVAEQLILLANA